MRKSLILISFSVLLCFCLPLVAGEKSRRCAGQLRGVRTELDRIEASESFEITAGEIGVARDWIKRGFDLLEKGEIERAVVVAERVSLQLVLIRALVSAKKEEIRVEKAEGDIRELLEKLASTRARLDRLILKHKGSTLTDAFPRKEEGRE